MNSDLERDAIELRRLNNLIVRAAVHADFDSMVDAIEKYAFMRKQIKLQLNNKPVAKISHPDAKEVLRKISEGEKLRADQLIIALENHASVDVSMLDFVDSELDELASDLFYSWFSPQDFVSASLEAGSLVASINVPDTLKAYVDEAKRCYALQCYIAVYSLCRTILETAVRDICIRRKLVRATVGNCEPMEKHRWSDLRNKVTVGSPALSRQLDDFYRDLSCLIHGNKTVTSKDALNAFKSTIKIVHVLYNHHRL